MNSPYKTAIEELQIEVDKLLSKVDGLRFAISTLRNNEISHPVKITESKASQNTLFAHQDNINTNAKHLRRSVSASSGSMIVYNYLTSMNRFVKISEISEGLSKDLSQQKVRNAISSLSADGRVIKIRPTTSNNDTFWGLPSWVDGEKVKTEHYYDESKLVGTKR